MREEQSAWPFEVYPNYSRAMVPKGKRFVSECPDGPTMTEIALVYLTFQKCFWNGWS
jgi:hypothetical protein